MAQSLRPFRLCSNKTLQTEWILDTDIYFSWSWRLLTKIRVPAWLGSGALQNADLSLCPHVLERARELSWPSFIRTLISCMSALPPKDLPKALPPSTITGDIRFQHTNFGRTQTFRP